MKNKTTNQIITDINTKIDGLTHDIKTLEGFATALLAMRLEIKALQEALRNNKHKNVCRFEHMHIPEHVCKLQSIIDNERD